MMESMIDHVKPNRSEITDVANAVLEGADAVMLSAETATGKHPAFVVETMRRIILEVEKTEYRYNREEDLKPLAHSPSFLSDAICYNACKIAKDANARCFNWYDAKWLHRVYAKQLSAKSSVVYFYKSEKSC